MHAFQDYSIINHNKANYSHTSSSHYNVSAINAYFRLVSGHISFCQAIPPVANMHVHTQPERKLSTSCIP